jgi:predicted NAD/FAD-dependent oxidoreductase
VTVCVVGAGIAGTACARVLHRGGRDVVVLDRGRTPGGRMSSRTLDGRPVDLGASYLTARDPRFAAQVEDWTVRGLARPWTDTFSVLPGGERKTGPVRYGAGRGLRALVEDLAADLDVRPSTQVERVGPGPTVDGTAYEAVVLAMPDPQALRLLDPALAAERKVLDGRTWQPVLALAARWDERAWDLDGAFVHDDDVLDWVADDGRRRGDGAPVLVAHSTPGFAAQHLEDASAAAEPMTAALTALLSLPAPAATHLQRWTYAKPADGREEPFFLGDARVGLCGDGWGASKVEAAWLSGTQLGEQLLSAG